MKYRIAIATIALIATSADADIFQCIDAAGKTIFKDSECGTNEVLMKTIKASETDTRTNAIALHIEEDGVLGINLINNSTFEDKLIDWKIPLGAFWSNSQGHNSSGALILQAKKPPDDQFIHETVVEQCVILNEAEKYNLSAQFKIDKIATGKRIKTAQHANRANVIWYQTLDCSDGGQYGWYIEPKNVPGWQSLLKQDLMPALGAKAAKITIVQNGRYSDSIMAYWDNISFAASEVFEKSTTATEKKIYDHHTLPVGTDRITNGGFDKNIASWQNSSKAVWSYRQGDAKHGSAKVTIESKEGSLGQGAFSQCINIGANTRFDLGASYKRDAAASTQKGGGRLRVTWRENVNCNGRARTDSNSADPQDISGWQKLEIKDLIALGNAQSVTIEIIQSVLGPGKSIVYWDDIYLTTLE